MCLIVFSEWWGYATNIQIMWIKQFNNKFKNYILRLENLQQYVLFVLLLNTEKQLFISLFDSS